MTRTIKILTPRCAARAVADGQSSSVVSGLLLFLFALVSFSLGQAQTLPFGRAGAMGTEKPGQTLFANSRDTNRATPVIERKDQPQSAWTGDDWGLPSLSAVPRPVHASASGSVFDPQAPVAPSCNSRFARGPPLFA